MKDKNNQPITEEEFTKGTGYRGEMPKKTTKELVGEIYEIGHGVGSGTLNLGNVVERYEQLLIQLEKQIKEEQLIEILNEYNEAELRGKGYDFYFSIRNKLNNLN